MTVAEAKAKLDTVISKSRIHFYKPIQIAEILHHQRTVEPDLDLLDLNSYRTRSRKWRDIVSVELLGNKCTSSARFQDDLFNENAVPPNALYVLGQENLRTNGAIEAYIYSKFDTKHDQLEDALLYCLSSTPADFQVRRLIDSFWYEAGLKRSLDKIYEIIVFSLFDTLVDHLEMTVDISVSERKIDVLHDFEDFAKKVMCLDCTNLVHSSSAHVYRVGVANAADRGLDMYSNWGPAIQIKHLVLSEELAESIVDSVSSDRIVIVCKAAESKLILSLLNQIGWKSKIQSIITENDLVAWYEKALRGPHSEAMGAQLLKTMCEQITLEFPSIQQNRGILSTRNYHTIEDPYWK